jgi:hypothetical protein
MIVIRAETPPPEKSKWHTSEIKDREEWSNVFETVTNWFCLSHGFRKEHRLRIVVNNISITINGEYVRYLEPSLRSAASLISKAYRIGLELREGEMKRSTPGIEVLRTGVEDYIKPYYHIQLDQIDNLSRKPKLGTIFLEPFDDSKALRVPGISTSQAVVWLNYMKR